MSTLRKLADVMAQNPNRTVLVEGFHRQHRQREPTTSELSERRADAVATALAGMGVPRERIAMKATAKPSRSLERYAPASRQLNRRVEIVLSNEGAAIPPRAAVR